MKVIVELMDFPIVPTALCHQIKSKINDRPKYLPKSIDSFSDLYLKQELLDGIEKMECQPTEIDRQVIWPLISSHPPIDVCLQSSNIYGAIGLAVAHLERLELPSEGHPNLQSIVVAPNRELGFSTSSLFINLCKYMNDVKLVACVGGTSFSEIEKQLVGAHILIATPGILSYLIHENLVKFENVKMVTFSCIHLSLEAGWKLELEELASLVKHAQICVSCFSPLSLPIQEFCEKYLKDPVHFSIN